MEKNSIKKARTLVIGVVILTIALFVVAYSVSLSQPSAEDSGSLEALAGNCRFNLEIADSIYEQYKGLSHRDSLCSTCGLLFVFSDFKQRNFVMRDMHFPLDIIYIKDGVISEILPNLQPENGRLSDHISQEKIDMALEINAGLAQRCGLKVGSSIYFSTKKYD